MDFFSFALGFLSGMTFLVWYCNLCIPPGTTQVEIVVTETQTVTIENESTS